MFSVLNMKGNELTLGERNPSTRRLRSSLFILMSLNSSSSTWNDCLTSFLATSLVLKKISNLSLSAFSRPCFWGSGRFTGETSLVSCGLLAFIKPDCSRGLQIQLNSRCSFSFSKRASNLSGVTASSFLMPFLSRTFSTSYSERPKCAKPIAKNWTARKLSTGWGRASMSAKI